MLQVPCIVNFELLLQEVAIKMLYKNNQKDQEIFLREISMLKFVARDRNVVQFYGVSIQNNGIWLITELMQVSILAFLHGLRVASSHKP